MEVMEIGCAVATGVIELVDAIVKKESKLRKLIKSLKKCCACTSASSGSDEQLNKEEEDQDTST
jgi:translation initiation factor 1 (eIF-1/SUI1)